MKSDTVTNVVCILLRVALGLALTFYGLQKTMGLFGGPGLEATMDMMGKGFGIPPAAAAVASFGELLGGLGVLAGCLTRYAAAGLAVIMGTAVFFSARGLTTLDGVGPGHPMQKIAYPGAFLVMAICLALLGGGDWSLDKALFGKKRKG